MRQAFGFLEWFERNCGERSIEIAFISILANLAIDVTIIFISLVLPVTGRVMNRRIV